MTQPELRSLSRTPAAERSRRTLEQWRPRFSRPSDVEFRLLLDKLPAAAYTCDADGLITYFNPRAVEFWGREPKLNDPVDRFCGSFRLFLPDGSPIPHSACWMALALRDRREYNGQEIVVERQDGERLTALAHANPLYDDDDNLIGAVNVLVDITDRKRAETLLREADRAKNEFLAMLAHELRNPLAPMHSALRLMREANGDPSSIDQARGALERQLEHLTRVVDDLLDLSRISRNELELRVEPVELGSVVWQAVETARPLADSVAQNIEVTLPAEPVVVNADPVRLAQVFANLLNNACKYSDPDGRVVLTVDRQGSDVVVAVRDTGIGIEPEMLPRIFDLFSRGSADRSGEGLGVGLSLARRIAEMHGGSIEAFSRGAGTGSEFHVRLPVVLAPVRKPVPPTGVEKGVAPPRRLRILVVDDNRDAAETLSELLELAGHETQIVHDGASAVESVRAFRPEAVLLDIGLPRMSGYEAARRIRALPEGGTLLLVALTGWGEDEDRRRSEAAGFDHHLVKPVPYERLAEILTTTTAAAH